MIVLFRFVTSLFSFSAIRLFSQATEIRYLLKNGLISISFSKLLFNVSKSFSQRYQLKFCHLSRLITSSGRAPTRLSMAYIVITQTFIPRGVHRCRLSAVPNSSVYSVYKPDQGLPSPSQHDEWLLRTHSNDAGRRRDPSPAPPWCASGFIADTTHETQAMRTPLPQGRCHSSRPVQLRCPTQHMDARSPSAHAQAAEVDQKLMVVVDVSRGCRNE